MTSPLERAARALYALTPQTMDVFTRDCSDPKSVVSIGTRPIEWDDLDDEDRDPFVAVARAVLAAIREPSEGMVGAGLTKARECTDDWSASAACLPGHCWTAMIDAALSEGG